MPARIGGGPVPVADKDAAETFGESGVTTTHNNTTVSSESVELIDSEDGSTVTRDADDNTTTTDGQYGLSIVPNTALSGVRVTLSANCGTATHLYVYDPSDGSLLADKTGSWSAGESVEILVPMESGKNYHVVFDDEGADWTIGYGPGNFDYTSADVDIDEAALGPQTTQTSASYAIIDVTALIGYTSGSTYVEWPYPTDIYSWDVGVYQASQDGGTVDVYVEEAQGSPDWTEIAGPMRRGDSLPADPSNNVRYRVEISRPDFTSNPTLDAIYRRIKL